MSTNWSKTNELWRKISNNVAKNDIIQESLINVDVILQRAYLNHLLTEVLGYA